MFRPRKETEGSHMGGFPVLTKGVRDVSWKDKDDKKDRETKKKKDWETKHCEFQE